VAIVADEFARVGAGLTSRTMSDPEILRGGGDVWVQASFCANAYNELYTFYTKKRWLSLL